MLMATQASVLQLYLVCKQSIHLRKLVYVVPVQLGVVKSPMSEAPEWLVDSAMGNIFSLLFTAACTQTMINVMTAQLNRIIQNIGVWSCLG